MLSLVYEDDSMNLIESSKRFNETPEEFDERQKRGREAFDKFDHFLTHKQAHIVIENVDIEAIEAILITTPERVERWAKEFLRIPDHMLMCVHNFALVLARAMSTKNLELSLQLFKRLEGRDAYTKVNYGIGKISLETISIWKSANNTKMDELRARRLDHASTDHELALEVLAALKSGKSKFLDQYIERLFERKVPSATARALMICGFGETTPEKNESLDRYIDAKGLIGKAVRASKFAYDRDQWARHWFKQMCQTKSSEDFWRYSILFLKIVDARFELWEKYFERKGTPISNFWVSLEHKLQNRIKNWAKKRKKTLFGTRVPECNFFLSH